MLSPSSFSPPNSSNPPLSFESTPYLIALPKKIKEILNGQEEGDPNRVVRTMKTPNHKRSFNKKIQKRRFLGHAQENLIGEWMMEKWKMKKDGRLLRQYICYEDSKKRVEELFNEFWRTLGIERYLKLIYICISYDHKKCGRTLFKIYLNY